MSGARIQPIQALFPLDCLMVVRVHGCRCRNAVGPSDRGDGGGDAAVAGIPATSDQAAAQLAVGVVLLPFL
ncbi:hypothetical protein GCM10028775_27930 [Catellatospora paridis]